MDQQKQMSPRKNAQPLHAHHVTTHSAQDIMPHPLSDKCPPIKP